MSKHKKNFALIYQLQFQKGLNPIYIVFTKIGFFYTIFLFWMMNENRGGAGLILLSLFMYWMTYQKYFPFKYYELHRVWLVALFRKILTKRVHKPFESQKLTP